MKNDRPKVICAIIAFWLAGGSAISLGITHPGGTPLGRTNFAIVGAVLLFLGVVLLLILLNDPYSVAPGKRGALRRNGRAHVLQFTVGDAERHDVLYRWDQVWGWITVTVDDVLVSKQLVTLSFRLVRALQFEVGHREKHSVRIEKRRTLFFAFAQPQPIEAYVDGVLTASDNGETPVQSN